MSNEIIYARERDGEIQFRLWDGIDRVYLTEPLSEEEIRTIILIREIQGVVEDFDCNIDRRIELAKKWGTSRPGPDDAAVAASFSLAEYMPSNEITSQLKSEWGNRQKRATTLHELEEQREKLERTKLYLEKLLAIWPK